MLQFTKNDISRFREVLDIPDFLIPWIDRFYSTEEIHLVLLAAGNPLRIGEFVDRWVGDEHYRDWIVMHDFLVRCCKRGVVCRCDQDRFQTADFHERFDSWALFEGWMDIPDDIRDQLNTWELDYYRRRHVDQINTLKRDGRRDPSLTWPEYVLQPEAIALIDQADYVYLWPCNCRSMMGHCTKNIYTCLRFSNHRDAGWEISRSRAREIVVQSNKNGLMQNAEISLNKDGSYSGAICNCCSDCCFPHQLAEQQDAAKLWPLTRYVAGHLVEQCTGCGNCVKRCPFKAFTYGSLKNSTKLQSGEKKKTKRPVVLDSSLCRGCGVCSTGCPVDAIEMIRLEHVESAWEGQLLLEL